MKLENIEKIGKEKGVKNLKVFVSFLSKRFPDENDRITSYFEGWADRFNTGSPENYMDDFSKSVYDQVQE